MVIKNIFHHYHICEWTAIKLNNLCTFRVVICVVTFNCMKRAIVWKWYFIGNYDLTACV